MILLFYSIFDQTNAALVSRRHLKLLTGGVLEVSLRSLHLGSL